MKFFNQYDNKPEDKGQNLYNPNKEVWQLDKNGIPAKTQTINIEKQIQEFYADTEINNIVKKYNEGDIQILNKNKTGQYLNIQDAPKDLIGIEKHAKKMKKLQKEIESAQEKDEKSVATEAVKNSSPEQNKNTDSDNLKYDKNVIQAEKEANEKK
ncbi:MAG: hypothetical protein LBV22_00140 [Mycoplasmataceae bacterium]|nr:hypothetical protein [Mycoplasmataceae bacterium]